MRGLASHISRTRAFILLRYTLIAATAYLLLVEDGFVLPSVPILAVIAAAFASNVGATWLPPRALESRWFTAGVLFGDTAWITAVLIYSGRFSPEFFYLYFFLLLLATIGESLGLIAIGAVVACVAYVYLLAANGGAWSLWNSPSVIRIPFLFTAAAFYGYLVDRTRREQRRGRAARAAARAKTRLLATVSHEIRTPMTGVLGWTGLLLDTNLSTEQREYAEGVRRSAETLLTIINDILDFSRMEAGRLRLEPMEFEPRQLVDDVTALLGESARRKRVELLQWVAPNVPAMLTGDHGRLRQILTNLVGNAVKFTAKGSVVIRVGIAERAADGLLVRFEVTDTGIGIPFEHQRRLFQPFVQADASINRKYGGTGLGLAISKKLALLMGGQIGVTSEPGRGSTFWFTARLVGAGSEPDAAAGPLRDVPVVVAHANEAARTVLSEHVRGWGGVADTAVDGGEALAHLRTRARESQGGAIVVADADLPGLVQVQAAVQDEPALAASLVVLGGTSTAATVAKPVRPARLYEALLAALSAESSARISRRAARS